MSLPAILHSFFVDKTFTIVAVLIGLDFVLGVSAAFKTRTFDLAYLVAFLRDDVLSKVVPWLAVFAGSKVESGTLLGGYGTLDDLQKILFAGITVSMGASIVKSLNDLGLTLPPVAAKVGIGRGASVAQYPDLPDQGNANAASSAPAG